MDSDSLRIFKAVAEAGSVTRAAGELHYVPSNVTARIRSLEEDLGKNLFIRKPRGMQLTPAGDLLLTYARRVQSILREARAGMDNFHGPAGPFSLGATDSVVANWLADKLILYAEKYPDVALSLEVAPSRQLEKKVLDNELEAALVSSPVENTRLAAREIFVEELVLVTAPGVADPARAAEAVVLQRNGCSFRRIFERWLAHKGIEPCRKLEMPTSDVALHCVARGMGVAIMPVSTIERLDQGDTVRTHHVPESMRYVPILLVRDSRLAATRAYEAFEEQCLAG